MRPLVLLCSLLSLESAYAQTSQPVLAPTSAPTSLPLVITNVSPPSAFVQPPTKAEPIPPKKTLLPEVHFLLQAWYDSAPAAGAESTFRIRRAEVIVRGEIIAKRVKYNIMGDLSKEILKKSQIVEDEEGNPVSVDKDDDAVLQDAWFAYSLPNGADIQMGQFKTPIALEGFNSTSKLYFPERSIVSRNFGDKRDIGVSIIQRKDTFFYTLGYFNGGNLNELDKDNTKDVTGRFEAYPKKGLTLAAAALVQVFNEEGSQKTRFEVDAKYEKKLLVLVSELHMATDGAGLVPLPFDDRLQMGARYSLLIRDLRAEADEKFDSLQELTLGANLYIKENQAKLQGSISRFIDLDPDKSFTEIIIAGQASF
jgi:Phosphate-selective porin O and P